MRAGRSVTSEVTADSRDAETVAYFPVNRCLEGLADAFIEACRTGIPADHLPGQTTFSGQQTNLTIDTIAQRIRDLENQATEAKNEHENALAAIVRLDRNNFESDDDMESQRAFFEKEAKRARSRQRAALAEIAQLEVASRPQKPTGPFDAMTHVIVPAMSLLKVGDGRVSQQEQSSLDLLLTSLTIDERAGEWWAEATIRLNTVDGLAEMGPIEWYVKSAGVGGQVLRQRITDRPQTGAESKAALINRLRESKAITEEAARVLGNALFPQLPHVVLNGATGEPFPEWVGEQWRQPEFVNWVTSVYTDPDFVWLGKGKYVQVAYRRQLFATFAETHSRFTVAELDAELRLDSYKNCASVYRPPLATGKVRRFEPSVRVVERRIGGEAILGGIPCDCKKVATIVARIPEAPRDLLCECLRAPGADPQVRFPEEYRALRLSWEECLAYLARRRSAKIEQLDDGLRAVLLQRELLDAGATDAQLVAAVSVSIGSSASLVLRDLRSYGYVTNDGGRPALWRYTAAGRARAESLLTDGPEGSAA